ncbi:dihydroorotate dehydrogenase electron transfer subunit [Dysosmobacter sp.]|uniref:dihydroorotate dehydrogenase electron transfer subunit n=1 Tax=Dysosmobacter sp. TaxID=2591382 RepID=UPI002A8B9156|nr:dihydroorotate dehydrogenase electron transfer subunit [Dysosmobacter sp.]MDY3282281.1 dihydroorotate dehydrogenase electron transfer subunit [Dysosmobacter sp.]
MIQTKMTLFSARQLTKDVWELAFTGDTEAFTRPGQFVNIELPGRFLRRPISVASYTDEGMLLLVRLAGAGTADLVSAPAGTAFDTLTGLGNGFDPEERGEHPVLIGGGIGIAPLYGLARKLVGMGLTPHVALGFRSADDVFYVEEFAALGCRVFVATEDGSLGTKGFVTDCVRNYLPEADYAFVCGPTPMLKAVDGLEQLKGGQFSFEARMACGFGACVGCTIPTANGPRRVCKDGPVFRKEEIVW